MTFKEEISSLIRKGKQVKNKCYIPDKEWGIYDCIKGADYVAWIDECKIFLKNNIQDRELYEEFLEASKNANGGSVSRFEVMIGKLSALHASGNYKGLALPETNDKIEKIFISHSSQDVAYVSELVDLLNKIGIKKNKDSIFCSSLPEYDIPYGENIYDYLKSELSNTNTMVLFVLSHNYYESAPCLNEMGAAWVLAKEYNSILTPNFEFRRINGAIDPTKISFHLNNEKGLDKFRDALIKDFELENIDYKIWAEDRKGFLERVNIIAQDEAKRLNTEVNLQRVRKLADGTLEVELRFINITDKNIEFKYIDIDLIDDNGNKVNLSVEDSILDEFTLRDKENKVISWNFDIGSSDYNPRRDTAGLSKVSFEIYS